MGDIAEELEDDMQVVDCVLEWKIHYFSTKNPLKMVR